MAGNFPRKAGRKPITEDQEPAVLAALGSRPLRDQALVILGMNTGFRITELLSLDVAQVWEPDAVRTNVKVTRAKLKGGRSRRRRAVTSRIVPLNPAATAILQKYLFARFGSGGAAPGEPLFPSRKHGHRLLRWRANTIVHEVIRAAGFDDQDAYGTHSLRKRFANRIYQATKFDLNLTRAIMGHRNVSTTVAYLTINEADAVSAVSTGDSIDAVALIPAIWRRNISNDDASLEFRHVMSNCKQAPPRHVGHEQRESAS